MRYQLTDTTRHMFIERFNTHGHDTRITGMQGATIGGTDAESTSTIFWCHNCDHTATVHSLDHGGWFCEDTRLDLKCG